MPVEFLTDEEVAAYGRFNGPPSRSELGRSFLLKDRDRELVRQRRRPHTRLGFAHGTPALFLNRRGDRLSARDASDVVAALADAASQEDETTAHVLRHTFGSTLVRGGADLVLVAELMGHARLETTRAYTRSTADDRAKALDLLPVDR